MTAATGIVGPVLKMCEQSPACGGLDCPGIRKTHRTMGLTETAGAATTPEVVLRVLRQELAWGGPKDSKGIAHMVPDGCEFTVHKASQPGGTEMYAAVYSGPEMDLDEILADSPEWDHDRAAARLAAMHAADQAA